MMMERLPPCKLKMKIRPLQLKHQLPRLPQLKKLQQQRHQLPPRLPLPKLQLLPRLQPPLRPQLPMPLQSPPIFPRPLRMLPMMMLMVPV